MKKILLPWLLSLCLAFALGWVLPHDRQKPPATPPPGAISDEEFLTQQHRLTTSFARQLEADLDGVDDEAERKRVYREWNDRRKDALSELRRRHGRALPGE